MGKSVILLETILEIQEFTEFLLLLPLEKTWKLHWVLYGSYWRVDKRTWIEKCSANMQIQSSPQIVCDSRSSLISSKNCYFPSKISKISKNIEIIVIILIWIVFDRSKVTQNNQKYHQEIEKHWKICLKSHEIFKYSKNRWDFKNPNSSPSGPTRKIWIFKKSKESSGPQVKSSNFQEISPKTRLPTKPHNSNNFHHFTNNQTNKVVMTSPTKLKCVNFKFLESSGSL